jgi:hypothetical protein
MTLFTITGPLLWAFYWLLKSTFLGGWVFARWLAWLLSPIWVTTAAIGAVSGFFTGK